ncbi:MAG TPA: indolepyruvate oxidoreductase subunit beta [Myxococcota bacterium]|nr:indolepyruvate oxidoreductase subunit beta [Myxococcota bacterium]HOH76971.1 indolepyruvate oxidoreductase subunit beta [Myxococcota bacterium]
MKYDVILAGVGGQGILTIAYLLDNAAINRGLRFKQAEVHGMAQRGGAVYSHMRISDREIVSDIIPEGRADMVLSVEPLEIHRYLYMLSPEGVVVSNIAPVINIPDYPDQGVVLDALYNLPRPVALDAGAIATEAGVPKAENMAMAGAATAYMPFDLSDYEPIIRKLFERKGPEMVVANMKVLENGYRVGKFTRALLEAGLPGAVACRAVAMCRPDSLDVVHAPRVVELLRGQKVGEVLSKAREGLITLDDLIVELA